ncbi:hypothetical protein SZ64_07740 [Erythrobacter sp. SG61-1L]|uniref:hypothetical protein n=1 Tax=Erythrobacter sp. SG61-1L TaxID=1603897 RepID=UPI0006C93413|nr:hypothetical protein [Erythrobacter sp. SG61-1L]KPL68024.1 hypothetical protein SZ64_07740 [Erythrobacter sp. SG61-1L]
MSKTITTMAASKAALALLAPFALSAAYAQEAPAPAPDDTAAPTEPATPAPTEEPTTTPSEDPGN